MKTGQLMFERPDGSSYAFVIRHRVVGSRTLEEEVARVEKVIRDTGATRFPGGYRLTDRVRQLRARIEKLKRSP